MKKISSLVLGLLMAVLISIPAFAANAEIDMYLSYWCSECGGKMTTELHYTGWVTKEFVDCTHGIAASKDARQECLRVVNNSCPRCGNYEILEDVQERYRCYASTRAIEETEELAEELAALPVTGECTECENGEVVRTFHRQTPWITVATTEDGMSEQTCIDVSNYQCRNCFNVELQEETLSRTVKLH